MTKPPADDPFADDDPLDGPPAPPPGAAPLPTGPFDDDFDALGFDTGFGLDPASHLGDDDDTPPGGIYAGEEVQVLDASAIGRALAEVEGRTPDEVPDMGPLQEGLVGIDLGASAAVVACFDARGRHQIVPNHNDERITPGQIFFDDDGERIVGREARLMAASAPGRVIVDLKGITAQPGFSFQPGGEGPALTAVDVLSIFIGQLLEDTRARGFKASHVAMAAPAWYEAAQRELMGEAVRRAGATLVGITDECLAAAVPYSLRLPDLNPRRAVVFDLGHAALGVGIVRCASGDIEVLAKGARRDLGSSHWDELLMREAGRKFKQVHGVDLLADEGARMDLQLRAEDAKLELSRRPRATLIASAGGKSLKVAFSRRGFEEAARPLLERSLAFAREVREQAGFDAWDEIDAVILAGGGCKTPAVRRALIKEVGRDPERGVGLEEGVAVGALYWGIGERHRQGSPA